MKGASWLWTLLPIGLFFTALAIRGYSLSTLIAYPDEMIYGIRALHILGSNWAWLPQDMWDQPPLLIYLIAGVLAVFGGGLEAARWVSVISGALSVLIAYYLGKSMYGRVAGIVASVAIMVDGFDILYSRLIYIEALATMLILGATLLFWEGVVKKRDVKLAAAGGLVFGLAMDSKYISFVMAAALVLFLIIYRNKFQRGFPGKEALVFFLVSLAVLLPVFTDLAVNNVDPFYWDLATRFSVVKIHSLAGTEVIGQLLYAGFSQFTRVLFHVSSLNPFQVYPPLVISIPTWTAIVIVVCAVFGVSFLFRRNPADGLLVLLFLGFLAFQFTYPNKRIYFSLYPSVIFLVMLGGLFQRSIGRVRLRGKSKSLMPYLALGVIALTVLAVSTNAFAVPVMYQNGFGDWDEIAPIVTYINNNHLPNAYVATSLPEFGYYIELDQVNVSVAFMIQPSTFYATPPINQTLQTPYKGVYPLLWVISPDSIEKLHPQFIAMPAADYDDTTLAFQQWVTQRYYQPLSTQLFLLFEVRPNSTAA